MIGSDKNGQKLTTEESHVKLTVEESHAKLTTELHVKLTTEELHVKFWQLRMVCKVFNLFVNFIVNYNFNC